MLSVITEIVLYEMDDPTGAPAEELLYIPAGERAYMNALVDIWHRDTRARNRYRAGRLHVSSCNGLPKMCYPVAYMGDVPKLRRSPYPPHNIRRRRPLRLAW